MRKLILMIMMLLIATAICTSQNDCVSRMNRYREAPSITTIYPCNSIQYDVKNDVYSYNMAILCDSVYAKTKTYKLYAAINEGMGYPEFQLYMTNGDTVKIRPDMHYPNMTAAIYIEAKLEEEVLVAIRQGRVRAVAIDHWNIVYPPDPTPVKCDNFFQDFLAKH